MSAHHDPLVPVNLRSSQADTRGGFNYTPTTKFVRIKCRKAENQSGVAIGLMGARTTCRGHYVPPSPRSISTSISSILSFILPPRIRNAPLPIPILMCAQRVSRRKGGKKKRREKNRSILRLYKISLYKNRSIDILFYPLSSLLFLYRFIVEDSNKRFLDRKEEKSFSLSAIFPLP